MKRITRREFLQMTAAGASAGAAASFLGACSPAAGTAAPTPSSSPFKPAGTMIPADTPANADSPAPASEPSTTAPDYAHLTVARGGDDPEQLVRRAVAGLGGMERFVAPGARVVIKPNICVSGRSFEYAATTNPWVVAGLVKMCREAGAARVVVLDFPFGGTSDQAYASSGIQDAVLAAGGEMEPISFMKFISTDLPGAQYLRQANVYDDVLQADTFINVPVAKHHSLARLTLGMKNLLGVVQDRPNLHSNLPGCLTDLSRFLHPALTVVDAVRILTANGPTGGNLNDVRKLDTVIASADFVAADAYGATLFGLDGYNDIPYIAAAADAGLGAADLAQMKIEEISVGA